MINRKSIKIFSLILVFSLIFQFIFISSEYAAEVTPGVQVEIEFADEVLYSKILAELDKKDIKYETSTYTPEKPIYKIEIAASEIEKVTELDLSNEREKIAGEAFKVGSLSNISEQDTKKVLASYDEFQTYFNKYSNNTYDDQGQIVDSTSNTILNKYKEDFFSNKSLAVIYVSLTTGSASVKYINSTIENNTVKIEYKINYPAAVGTDDMSGYFVVVEVDKNISTVLSEEYNREEMTGETIKDLSGIEKFTSLKKLNLANNEISSAMSLDDLNNLEFVSLKGNCLSSLNGLTKLIKKYGNLAVDFIDLRDNYIEDSYMGFEGIEQSLFFTFGLDINNSSIISNKEDYAMLGIPEYELGGSAIGLSKDKTKILLDTSTLGEHTAIVRIRNGLREGTEYRYTYNVSKEVFREDPNYKPTIIDDEFAIYNISPETKVSDFKESLNENDITVEDNDTSADNNEIIKTGMKINKDNTSYTLIVKGDISQTGTNDITDLLRLKSHITKDQELSGILLKAADITDRGKVDITDLLRLKEMVIDN